MTALLLFFLLLFVGLAVVLAIVASLMHTSFYEQPLEGITWRAPTAAAGIIAFLALWAFIEFKAPGRFDTFFRYSASNDRQFEQFWSEKKSEAGTTETLFRSRVIPPGRVEYVDANGRAWRRSDSGVVTAIIVEEDGERRRFVAQLDSDYTFFRDPSDPNSATEVKYIEDGGKRRVMTEGNIGTLSNTRFGTLFLNFLFNFLLLVVWIIAIGLGLELGWWHAIVIGTIGWLLTLLLIWPPLQSYVAALPKLAPVEELAHCRTTATLV